MRKLESFPMKLSKQILQKEKQTYPVLTAVFLVLRHTEYIQKHDIKAKNLFDLKHSSSNSSSKAKGQFKQHNFATEDKPTTSTTT